MDSFLRFKAEIAHLASRQQGHVARQQLLALGIPPSTVDHLVASGALIRVHQGVYAIGYRRVDPLARAAAAVLACGDDAVLSHDSAAALWELRRWPADPEVISSRYVRRRGIRSHRSVTLTRAQTTRQHGIRVTTVARTLQDIAHRLTARRYTRLVNNARVRRLLSGVAAAQLLGESILTGPTRSQFEDAFIALIRRFGLPMPLVNAIVGGDEVDIVFPHHRVIVELDGWDTHRSRASFESDRERDARHAELGYLTVRVTWARLQGAPAEEARRLRRILDSRQPVS